MAGHAGVFETAQRALDAARCLQMDFGRTPHAFSFPAPIPREVYPALQRKFSPDQPRVPAGNPTAGSGRMVAVVSNRDGGGGLEQISVPTRKTTD